MNITSDYIFREEFGHLLAALMPENRLALEVSLATGLRIDDVLSIKTAKLSGRMTVTESKTGKKKRVYLPAATLLRMQQQAGKIYVFEGRLSFKQHRTRQAVYKDLKRAASLFRIVPGCMQISPHTARKIYAVGEYARSGGDLHKVQQLLNHSSEAVTMLYAMADTLTARRHGKRKDSL